MAIIEPSSAIIAKIKSQYGKRLTQKDYRAMVKCESVSEVVQYLKTYTHYQNDLSKVSTDVHRGNLENIMREKQFENLLTFCKYNSGNTPVIRYILRSTEINELMRFITLLSISRPREYLFSLPLYFNRYTDIKLDKLASVNDHQGLLNALQHTDYERIIRRFPPNNDGDYDLAAIEDALENESLATLYNEIEKIKSKKNRTDLKALFDSLADYGNYSRIIRLKRYYRLDNSAVREHLLRYGQLTGKRLDKILQKDDYDEIYARLRQTSVGKKAKSIDADSEMAIQGRYELCRHKPYFSTNPEVVLLAYHIVSQIELANVVAVIEGVRYRMNPENIYEMLVL